MSDSFQDSFNKDARDNDKSAQPPPPLISGRALRQTPTADLYMGLDEFFSMVNQESREKTKFDSGPRDFAARHDVDALSRAASHSVEALPPHTQYPYYIKSRSSENYTTPDEQERHSPERSRHHSLGASQSFPLSSYDSHPDKYNLSRLYESNPRQTIDHSFQYRNNADHKEIHDNKTRIFRGEEIKRTTLTSPDGSTIRERLRSEQLHREIIQSHGNKPPRLLSMSSNTSTEVLQRSPTCRRKSLTDETRTSTEQPVVTNSDAMQLSRVVHTGNTSITPIPSTHASSTSSTNVPPLSTHATRSRDQDRSFSDDDDSTDDSESSNTVIVNVDGNDSSSCSSAVDAILALDTVSIDASRERFIKKKRGGGKIGRKRKRGYIYDPKPLVTKSKTTHFPSEAKDDEYWDKRRRNNAAAKRSRENRRVKELETVTVAKELQEKNDELRERCNNLEERNRYLETLLNRKTSDSST